MTKRCPSHPGAVLGDILQDVREPKTVIAAALGVSRQHLHDVLSERKPMSASTAARVGKLVGNGATIWLRLQAAYDAWHAEREIDVSGVKTLEQANMTKRREHDFTREPGLVTQTASAGNANAGGNVTQTAGGNVVQTAGPSTAPAHMDDAEVSRQAGRLLGRLKRGDSTEAVLKGTLELLLDMHR